MIKILLTINERLNHIDSNLKKLEQRNNLNKVYEDEQDGINTKSSKKTKPSLFSRDISAVKAAIDSGESVETTNRNSITPLVYACRDKSQSSNNIIKLLLENGATPNDYDGQSPVIYTAIENGNDIAIKYLVDYGAKLDVVANKKIKSATGQVSPFDYALFMVSSGKLNPEVLPMLLPDIKNAGSYARQLIHIGTVYSMLEMVSDGTLPINIAKDLSNKIYSNWQPRTAKSLASITNRDAAKYDLSSATPFLFDIMVANQFFPFIAPRFIKNLSSDSINKVYKAIQLANAGKVTMFADMSNYCSCLISVYNILNKTIDKNSVKFITQDNFVNECKSNPDNAGNIILFLGKNGFVDKINELSKIDVNQSNADKMGSYIVTSLLGTEFNTHKEVYTKSTPAICKFLTKVVGKISIQKFIFNIVGSHNKYLIDYLLDNDIDNIGYISKTLKSSPYMADKLSEEASSVFKEYNLLDADTADKYNKTDLSKYIINCIKDDNWGTYAEDIVSKHPDILLDKRVQDTLDNVDDDNATARQLLKRIEKLPKSVKDAADDLYDM